MQQVQSKQLKWPMQMHILGCITALLILIGGVALWTLNARDFLPALLTTSFGVLATIFTFSQALPIFFAQKSSGSALPSRSAAAKQLNNTSPPANTAVPASAPAVPSSPALLTLRGVPLPTDPHSVQQREVVVKGVYALLIEANTSAVVLSGIDGIGKSTIAALVLNYAERERLAGRGPFRGEAVLLRINENTSFLELSANIFAAVGKSTSDVSGVLPQNQAFALCNVLNTADTPDTPRLIILDQFENLLEQQSRGARYERLAVGEFLDALNCRPCACRVLLTSRPYAHSSIDDTVGSVRISRINGLEGAEGVALLRNKGLMGSEDELREVVRRCDGHALSLALLRMLPQTYTVSLGALLRDAAYAPLWHGLIMQNLLDGIFTNLPELSRQLLCAFSLYREAVPIHAVQAVVASTTKAQPLILASLLQQHLIQSQTPSGAYQLHPIVANYAQQHFIPNDELANQKSRQEGHSKAADYYLQEATEHCPPRDKRRSINEVQPLLEAVWHFTQAEQHQKAYELMEQELLFDNLRLWGANSILLDVCQALFSPNWQPTSQQQALIYSTMASTLGMLGHKQEAMHYCEQALRVFGGVGDQKGESTTLNKLGDVYNALGQKQEALQYYQQALRIFTEVGDQAGEATSLNNLGSVYQELGQMQKVLQYYQQALRIFGKVGDHEGEGATLNNIGFLCTALEQRQVALQYYEHALRISREVSDRKGEGTTLNNIGFVYNALDKKQEALQYYQQALQVSREVGDREGEATILNNIGSLHSSLGQQQEALQSYQQALHIFGRVRDRGGEGVALNNLGLVYDALDKKQEALQSYQQALRIRREVADYRREGTTLHNIGMIYYSQQHYELALAYIVRAKALFEREQSPSDVDVEAQWIAALRKSVGEARFTTMLAQVEPRAEQMVEEMLQKK
ncbi:MAG: tetratricopeptide repeat protein [Chloroflexi bacterium]|nr:tetratricopeptide repeat protein [Ktedonobacteraceae bacterium]MBV9708896.1 tetratricopeptide repeat protein [Chloroflexota bacterium]